MLFAWSILHATLWTQLSAVLQADAYFSEALPLPQESPDYVLEQALDKYTDAEEDDPSKRAEAGVAKCLFHLGRYNEAATEFDKVGDHTREHEAHIRASLASKVLLRSGALRVLQVEPVPGSSRWLALLGDPASREPPVRYDSTELRLITASGRTIRRVPLPVHSNAERNPQVARFYWIKLDHDRRARVLMVYRRFMAADCDPTEVRCLYVGKRGFSLVLRMSALGGAGIYATKPGQILIKLAPTWKVWWPDVYEWNGDTLRFANSRHPNLYRGDLEDIERKPGDVYTAYAWQGALLDIRGRFRDALAAWLKAEDLLEKQIRYPGSDHPLTEFYGGDRENLNEIRKRIHWLRRRDYNHWLLYRPYGLDLETGRNRKKTLGRLNEEFYW